MRPELNFGPLFRTNVGFDRMLDALRSAMQAEPVENYPPCNGERVSEDACSVTLAAAGFRSAELAMTAQQNLLVVSGEPQRRAGAAKDNEKHRHRLCRLAPQTT